MTPRIPRDAIKHLEWTPGKAAPQQVQPPSNPHNPISPISIDDILKGKSCHNTSMPAALREAMTHAGSAGIVANLPEFVAAKAKVDKNHAFWQDWYTVLTEENIGVDKKGAFYSRGEPVLVVVHGGGILTPDRIQQAYDGGLIHHSAPYSQDEFALLLEGKLADGTSFPLYRLEEIKSGASQLPHQFGVVMPYATAKGTNSGYYKKKAFLENPLVLARTAGSHNYLEQYFGKAKDSAGYVGNFHPFAGRDASQPQGRVLFVIDYYNGLGGDGSLDLYGRFVGVAPEAPSSARK